jgi:hypothetical protein
MAGRSGRRRVDPGSPLVDLDAVFADDALIDAIAGQTWGGDPARLTAPMNRAAAGSSRGSLLTVDPLTELLELWRQELAVEPIPAAPDAGRAAAPVQRRPPSRKRTLRPALATAAAIGALLVGAASIGSKDAPRESPLFVLTQVLWPSRVVSLASADQVDAILLEARTAIQDGRTQDAQLALLRAAVVLGSVDDVDGKGDRQEVVAALWVEVAPQPSSTGTEPNSAAGTRPTTPGTRSAAPSSMTPKTPLAVLAAPATDSTTAAAQPAGAQVAAPQSSGPQIVPPAASSTGAGHVAVGPGWPTAVVTPPPVDGPAVTGSAAPSTAPVVPVGTAPPVAGTTAAPPSVPSTPPPPTVPVDPRAEVAASEPPSATEQSPPAPTPSEPSPTVETTAADGAGPFSSTETAAVNKLDPAAVSTG